eukprot:10553071-Ditylum_brightwellii.AAC.1
MKDEKRKKCKEKPHNITNINDECMFDYKIKCTKVGMNMKVRLRRDVKKVMFDHGARCYEDEKDVWNKENNRDYY